MSFNPYELIRIKQLTEFAIKEDLFANPNDINIGDLETLKRKWKIFFKRFMPMAYIAIVTPPLESEGTIPESIYTIPDTNTQWMFLCHFYTTDNIKLFAVDFDLAQIQLLYSEPSTLTMVD